MEKIDNLDRKILSIVMRNARIASKDVAVECGVSRAAIHQRIQRLNANGVILGSVCLINPSALGYDTCAFVGVILRDPAQYSAMVENLRNIPEVVECYYTSGQYDIFIKLFVRNNDHLLKILMKIQDSGWARTETLISFKQVFRRQPPVVNPS